MYSGSWEPVRQLIPNITLSEYQCRTALSVVTEKKHLILFETGLGKTLTTIAGLIMRKNSGNSQRILWLSPLDIIKQTREAFSRHSKFRSKVITGTSKELGSRDFSGADIMFANIEAFDAAHVVEWFITNHKEFDTVVIDEAHAIANPFSSNRNGVIWYLAARAENTYLLTATPTISRIDQYASLLCLLHGTLKDLLAYRTQIHNQKWLPDGHPKLLSYKKRDVIIPMEVLSFEEEVRRSRSYGSAMFKDTRHINTETPYKLLLKIIRESNLTHFLVYANITEHHTILKEFLETNTGLRVGIMNGTVKDKEIVQKAFNNNELDILVYSVVEGRDLPAESVIFFEWDVYAAQGLGRAIRSEFVQRGFKVWFIVNTLYERDMFENTVIKTGLLTEKALGKNIFKTLGG